MAYSSVNNSVFATEEVADGADVAQLNDNIEDTRSRVAQNESDIATIQSDTASMGILALRVDYTESTNTATASSVLNLDSLSITITAANKTSSDVDLTVNYGQDINQNAIGSVQILSATETSEQAVIKSSAGTGLQFHHRNPGGLGDMSFHVSIFYDRSLL